MGFHHRLHRCEWSISTVIKNHRHFWVSSWPWQESFQPWGLGGEWGWNKACCVFVYQLEVCFPFKWYAHSLTLERENHTYGQRYSLGLLCLFDPTSLPCHGSYGICTVDSAAPSCDWAWVLPVPILGTWFRTPAGATAAYVHVAPGQNSGILEEWVSFVTALEHCLPTNVNWTERRGCPCLW